MSQELGSYGLFNDLTDGESVVIQSLLQSPGTVSSVPRPTECLLHERTDQISLLTIYRRIMEGFAMRDAQALLMSCVLQSTTQTMSRGLGVSARAARRYRTTIGDTRLTPRQSALAFQYAKVLERSISVFGTQRSAEEWLGRSCRWLGGNVPLIMAENEVGAQAVEEYLRRVELGIYQ